MGLRKTLALFVILSTAKDLARASARPIRFSRTIATKTLNEPPDGEILRSADPQTPLRMTLA
jgi:hypothetical protein